MATAISNKPVDTLRERGGLKATLWKQSTQQGRPYYDCEISRTYRDDTGFHDSRYFRDGDLLAIARLATRTHDRIRELRSQDAAELGDIETGDAA